MKKRLNLPDTNIFGLARNEAITTVPSILKPRKKRFISIDWKTGRHGIRLVPASIPPGAEKAPPGFKILDDYVFTIPGEYTIETFYEGEIDAEPIFPHDVPLVFDWGLLALRFVGFDFYPDPDTWIEQRYIVNIRSNKLHFTVAPQK
ncbi:MAG: hypothetical protein COB53_13085 [Elusimicrobia bacterium]|nr:MAG: hypothetical protein COB53_13085 [Elusimicrobiota bacterium]